LIAGAGDSITIIFEFSEAFCLAINPCPGIPAKDVGFNGQCPKVQQAQGSNQQWLRKYGQVVLQN
jgi:hypothetical protein